MPQLSLLLLRNRLLYLPIARWPRQRPPLILPRRQRPPQLLWRLLLLLKNPLLSLRRRPLRLRKPLRRCLQSLHPLRRLPPWLLQWRSLLLLLRRLRW